MFEIKMRNDFARFSNDAIFPTKASPDAAGFDLYSIEEVIIPSSNVRIVQTDISFKVPKEYFVKIHARSIFAMQFPDVNGVGVRLQLYFLIFPIESLKLTKAVYLYK